MKKFIIELDINKGKFSREELRQIEYLLEKCLDAWEPDAPQKLGITVTDKVKKLWEKGCHLSVSYVCGDG